MTIVASGINGGIEYDMDFDALPPALASHIRYIEGGPDSPVALIDSTREIIASRLDAILPVLVDVLGFNNPIAAKMAVDALVESGPKSIPFLLQGVGAFNYAVNAYALRALGRIGDPSVREICEASARMSPIPNVRRAGLVALGSLRYSDHEEVSLSKATILELLNDPDWSVRYAAVVAIERSCIMHGFSADETRRLAMRHEIEEDRVVRGRIKVAMENLGAKVSVGV